MPDHQEPLDDFGRAQVFMREAIALSRQPMLLGKGGPFGAVVVYNDEIIARGSNLVTSTNDPTAHAEVVAIRAACQALSTFVLDHCELYTSCEPCPMCLGAIYWARLRRVYFANTRDDAAAIDFSDALIYDEISRPLSVRKIPFAPLLRDEALLAFHEWQAKVDKVPY